MKKLNNAVAEEFGEPCADDLPVKVLQFGTGNFLRGFMDWMIDEMNRQGRFNGRIRIVQSVSRNAVNLLAAQDNRYTLILRGIENGQATVVKTIVGAVAGGLSAKSQFDQVLREAENPDLRIIISNTTEAGIVLHTEDTPSDMPPSSFPGKLLRLMRHRYETCDGDTARGFLIFPCELIDHNGDTLKEILMTLAGRWYPGDNSFRSWLNDANIYFNTLVDRIVSGYPEEEADKICRELGYTDSMIDTGELFHFLAIEGPKKYEEEFPLISAGFNVKWCGDISPYKTRKVRILNGAHTMTVLAAHLQGLTTVRECMENPTVSAYLRRGIFEEIIPTLDLPQEELTEFGEAVLERFSNPFLRHLLLSISLNSVSKWKTRVMPSLLEYRSRFGKLPESLTFSLAALILFYRGRERCETSLKGTREVDGAIYDIQDSPEVLDWFYALWQEQAEISEAGCTALTRKVLAKKDFWGKDLREVQGLTEATGRFLNEMLSKGVEPVIGRLAEKSDE
ncbi:MAG: tagaturonate reductase [Lentisphaeria bacterium]